MAQLGNYNHFALSLYEKLRERDGNLFLSPFSIRVALAMTHAGARGETAAQMREVLALEGEDIAEAVQRLNAAGGGQYEMAVANSIWSQDDEPLLPEFIDRIVQQYGGAIHPVDFRHAAGAVRSRINQWVEDRTKSRIKDLIPPEGIDSETNLVLVNAIYFKGTWTFQFDPDHTRDAPFHLEDGGTVQVPMMHLHKSLQYVQTKGFQALDLGYQGGDLSMLVLLPQERAGLPDLEKSLTPRMLDECVRRLDDEEVKVFLPRFKVTWGTVDLAGLLKALGMPLAFEPEADFSGITGHRSFFIAGVFHKAFVEVNEEGTEAAAATAVTMARGMPPQVPIFRADHPFLFAIRDRRSGEILFLGRINDPTC